MDLEQEQDVQMTDVGWSSTSSNGEDVGGGRTGTIILGICAMEKKTLSKPMKEILTRIEDFEYIKTIIFEESVILNEPIEDWPICDCLISFHSTGFPLEKSILYAKLRNPFIINHLEAQFDILDRRNVYKILTSAGVELPRYAVLDRDSPNVINVVEEQDDQLEINGVVFNKPFVEKPVDAEDHNIIIYYPTSAGGGSQRLFRKIGSRSSRYSQTSSVRKCGSYIYEDFMATDGTDVKVYTVGPDYAHAEARKCPALDGKVERTAEGKEVRYPVILSSNEKLIARKVCLAFKQTVCGFDLLRANGGSYVCDVNGFSFVKNSSKYYDDCAKILGNMILRELAASFQIPWHMPFQLDDPPITITTVGKMMELRCVVAVIRHGDRTPKQKMKCEVSHPLFFELFKDMDGYKKSHVKLKKPKHLQKVLDIATLLIQEIEKGSKDVLIEKAKLNKIRYILEMYGHFSGINRKVQFKYQPKGNPKLASSQGDEPSLLLILKWGGELTPSGRDQAEELGKVFRSMYPGGQDLLIGGLAPESKAKSPEHRGTPPEISEDAAYQTINGTQGLGLLRLHSTYRHDLKIYASDEGRVQMTAAAFAKGLLSLEGPLAPILVQMVKSADTNGLLDNDSDASKFELQTQVKGKLHKMLQRDQDFTAEDEAFLNPCNKSSLNVALTSIGNPVKSCKHVLKLIQELNRCIHVLQEENGNKPLYDHESWDLMTSRWEKLERDFLRKTGSFDISKIPDIYDCIKYDVEHNKSVLYPGLGWDAASELYTYSQNLADLVIPQEYGITREEKLTIAQGICTPLLNKIRWDLTRGRKLTNGGNQGKTEHGGENEDTINRLNPRYLSGVSYPGRHVVTRLYFTSESHIHSLLNVFALGGMVMGRDEQWNRALEYISLVAELNYMTHFVIMLYEDPTKEATSDERFHVELHFSPGVNCCVNKDYLPPGPGFRKRGTEGSKPVSPLTKLWSTSCSEKQVNQLFERTITKEELKLEKADCEKQEVTTKSRFKLSGVVEEIEYEDERKKSASVDGIDFSSRNNSAEKKSNPIPIRKGSSERSSSENISSSLSPQSSVHKVEYNTMRSLEETDYKASRSLENNSRNNYKLSGVIEEMEYEDERTKSASVDELDLSSRKNSAEKKLSSCPIPIRKGSSERNSSSENISSSLSPQRSVHKVEYNTMRSLEETDYKASRSLEHNSRNSPEEKERCYATSKDDLHLVTAYDQRSASEPRTRSHSLIRVRRAVDDKRKKQSKSTKNQVNYARFLEELELRRQAMPFSTAVIDGQGLGTSPQDGVPLYPPPPRILDGNTNTRPLETLHNSLSLKQLDDFLELVTTKNFLEEENDDIHME